MRTGEAGSFVMRPQMEVRRTTFQGGHLSLMPVQNRRALFTSIRRPQMGELGKHKSLFKKIRKVVTTPFKLQRKIERKIWMKVVPKPIRKPFTRKNFIKYAPYLAAVAQVLNVIPGLGIAVGAAILAAGTAIGVAATIAKTKQAKADQLKATKQADAQARQAFASSNGYFTQKYGVTQDQFNAMSLDDKANFLQMATEDAQNESQQGGSAWPPVQGTVMVDAPPAAPAPGPMMLPPSVAAAPVQIRAAENYPMPTAAQSAAPAVLPLLAFGGIFALKYLIL